MILRNLILKKYKLTRYLFSEKHFKSSMDVKQSFDFILILDFEATCEKNTKLQPQVILLI